MQTLKSFPKSNLWLLSILSAVVVSALLMASTPPQEGAKPGYNADGELKRPHGYREWVYVGTPVTPNDMNGGQAPFPEFHAVYIHPGDYSHYQRTGVFQDGTVLIKELVSVGSKAAVSGKGYFMGEFLGLEAAVKDSVRFPSEPGHWAYFSFSTADHKSLKTTAKALETQACNACHQASAAEDWVFTQYYPVLRAAKAIQQAE